MTKLELYLIETGKIIALSLLIALPANSLSFDEALSPRYWMSKIQGQPQAQTPLPVPRTATPPQGYVGEKEEQAQYPNPCAPPPRVANAPTQPQSWTKTDTQSLANFKPRVPPSTSAVLNNIRAGQSMDGLIARVRQADDAETALDGKHDWIYIWREGKQTYRVGVKDWKVVSVTTNQ